MIENSRIFVKVVQLGSFSKAAALLKLPKSSVSRAVSQLESSTGTRLLVRTTRSLTLTAAGRSFFESCVGPLQTLEDALKSLDGQESTLQGTVKITGPEDLGSFVISPTLAQLSREYPGLRFELKYTNEVLDLVREGFDIAIRLGPLKQTTFKAQKLGEVVLIFAASPEYLKGRKLAKAPGESLDYLTFHPPLENSHWALKSQGRTVRTKLEAKIVSNQLSTIVDMCVQGAGVGLVPSYLCEEHFRTGKLVHVFKDWSATSYPVSLVTPLASNSSARLRLVSQRLIFDVKRRLAPD